jgi:hypothetical protein
MVAALAVLLLIDSADNSKVFPFFVVSPVRQLRLRRIGYEHRTGAGESNMRITAEVDAVGLDGRPISLEVRIWTADGRNVRVKPDSGSDQSDPREFRAAIRSQIQQDPETWKPFIDVRYDAVDLTGGQPMVIAGLVQCGGLMSLNQVELLLPEATQTPQALRMLGTEQWHNQGFAQRQYSTQQSAAGGIATSPVEMTALLTAAVEADAMAGGTVLLQLRLRNTDGSLVTAAIGAPPGYADDSNLFQSSFRDSIATDRARLGSLAAKIPYRSLALAGGREHRLILECIISAGMLRALSEEEFTVSMPADSAALSPAMPGRDPAVDRAGEQAARVVTEQFMSATILRDEPALSGLITGRLAAERHPPLSADTTQLRYEVQRVTIKGDAGLAEIRVTDQTDQGTPPELMLMLQLVRADGGWKVAWLDLDLYRKEPNPRHSTETGD